MSQFYQRLQGTASRLLRQFKQGSVFYVQPGTVTGPVYAPVVGQPVLHPLDATVSGVAQQYVDGALVVATDEQVVSSVFGTVPTVEGRITVDGVSREIVTVKKLPAAGTTIAYVIIIRS